jgi:hypothetical protein
MYGISFEGVRDVATFKLAGASSFVRGTDEGIPVKVSAMQTVAKCADTEDFDGTLESIDHDNAYGAVKVKGFKTLVYSGDAPAAGNVILVADGTGKVKTAATGKKYLVVDVDTTAKTVTFLM